MSARNTSYMFIDGGYLRGLSKIGGDLFEVDALPFDLSRVAGGHKRVFYYDCEPPQRNKSDKEHRKAVDEFYEFIDDINSLKGFHTFVGKTKGSGRSVRQKEIDVKITVDLLSHAYRRTMDRVILLAGDQDFKPLVNEVVRSGMYITVLCFKNNSSKDLRSSADERDMIDLQRLYNWCRMDFIHGTEFPAVSQAWTFDMEGRLVQKGTGQNGEDVQVWLTDIGEYNIFHNPRENGQQITRMTMTDKNFLLKVFEMYFPTINWE